MPMPRAAARILLLALLPLAACDAGAGGDGAAPGSADAPERAAMASHDGMDHDATRHTELAAAEPSGFSIYHAESAWTDATGAERRLASLRGRVQVVAMVYTSCAYACPRIMLDMKRIEGELGPGLAEDVGFVVVSIDPERDTPERLAEFARGSRLDPDRWTLLTGDEGDILELAALLGVQYRETAPGEFVHSNLITVLDADGVVVHRQLGLGTDPAATLDVIRGLTG